MSSLFLWNSSLKMIVGRSRQSSGSREVYREQLLANHPSIMSVRGDESMLMNILHMFLNVSMHYCRNI